MERAVSAEPLVLVGGGGHCRSCIEVIECAGIWRITGVLDPGKALGAEVSGYPVLGGDDQLEHLSRMGGTMFLITMGQMCDAEPRQRLFDQIKRMGGLLPVIQSSSATTSKRAVLGEGTIVLHQAAVNVGAQVGANCIVNTGALIEHDCRVGAHSHISTHAVLNGNVRVGDRCLIGSGAVIIQGVSICSDTVVGAGAVVIRDISTPGTYVGNPARKVG